MPSPPCQAANDQFLFFPERTWEKCCDEDGRIGNPGNLWGYRDFSRHLNTALTRSSPISLFSKQGHGRILPSSRVVFGGRIVGIIPVAALAMGESSEGFVCEAWTAGHFSLARCKIVETPVARN